MCKYWAGINGTYSALARLRGLEHFNICEGLKLNLFTAVRLISKGQNQICYAASVEKWTSSCLNKCKPFFLACKQTYFETRGSIDDSKVVIAVFVEYFGFSSMCLWPSGRVGCVLVCHVLVLYLMSGCLESLVWWCGYNIAFPLY